MSGKRKKGAGKAAPRAYGRLTRHERDTLQRMLERGASCRRIARELGRSPSTVSSEVASHRFVTAPRERRGERVDACLLTLLHRPSRLQLALPLAAKDAESVTAALGGVRSVLGAGGTGRVFRAVLTDNGPEFSDEGAIAALVGEGPGETRLFYCDPGRSDQKGACERNHVEIRKLLPKGRGLRFDRLAPADLSLAMSHVNSEPRGALGFATPARAFRAMLGDDAEALLEAYGIEDVPIDELDLTPGLIARAREERGDAPLS